MELIKAVNMSSMSDIRSDLRETKSLEALADAFVSIYTCKKCTIDTANCRTSR